MVNTSPKLWIKHRRSAKPSHEASRLDQRVSADGPQYRIEQVGDIINIAAKLWARSKR